MVSSAGGSFSGGNYSYNPPEPEKNKEEGTLGSNSQEDEGQKPNTTPTTAKVIREASGIIAAPSLHPAASSASGSVASTLQKAAQSPSNATTLDYSSRPSWLQDTISSNFDRLIKEEAPYLAEGADYYVFCDCENALGRGATQDFLKVDSNTIVDIAAKRKGGPSQVNVLDLGAGSGACGQKLLQQGYKAVSVSANAYQNPSDTYIRQDVERLFEFRGNADGRVPIKRGKYDVVLSRMTFIHLSDPGGAVQQAYEALAEGGVLAVDSLLLYGLSKGEHAAMVSHLRAQGYPIYAGAYAGLHHTKSNRGFLQPRDGLNCVIIRKSAEHPTLDLPLKYHRRDPGDERRTSYLRTCTNMQPPKLTQEQNRLALAYALGDNSVVASTAHDAILCGDLETLRRFVDTNCCDAESWVAAVQCGNLKALQILGRPDEQALTSLFERGGLTRIAIEGGHWEMVAEVVAFDGNLRSSQQNALDLLQRASSHPEVFTAILQQMPSLATVQDEEGNTPLHSLAEKNPAALARLVQEHGVSIVNERGEPILNNHGESIFHMALRALQNPMRTRLSLSDIEALYRAVAGNSKAFANIPDKDGYTYTDLMVDAAQKALVYGQPNVELLAGKIQELFEQPFKGDKGPDSFKGTRVTVKDAKQLLFEVEFPKGRNAREVAFMNFCRVLRNHFSEFIIQDHGGTVVPAEPDGTVPKKKNE